MLHMRTLNVRELHLRTSAIIREVAQGGAFVIEKHGLPVAELRPVQGLASTRQLPNREALFAKLPPMKTDAGRVLEQDRS